MDYIYLYTVYSDIGLILEKNRDNTDLIIKSKQITSQRDIFLLKQMQHLQIGTFPMIKSNFEKYKQLLVNLSLNNPLLYMMFVTKSGPNQVASVVNIINIGQMKTFISENAAYASIYNIDENVVRILNKHVYSVYKDNK